MPDNRYIFFGQMAECLQQLNSKGASHPENFGQKFILQFSSQVWISFW